MMALGAGLVLLALPPSLPGLGIVKLATAAPEWLDPVLRSRGTVCWFLGLRFFPVSALLVFRAMASFSASWTYAAAIHGVPLTTYLVRILAPHLFQSVLASVLLVALLATADVTSVLLLHPPGQGSLPLAIFTVMANAPESLVASLCLVYLGLAGGLVTLLWMWAGGPKE
jgi:iron(III) transport system permease protein